jgi:hypothetical protein
MVRATEVAAGLGVDPRTVKNAIKSRDIPGLIIGSLYLVNAAWYASVTSWPPVQEVAS